MSTLSRLPDDIIINITRCLPGNDLGHTCLADKDLDDVIKSSSELILVRSSSSSDTEKHWNFLDRYRTRTPEKLPRAIRDHNVDPHVAVMFAIRHGMSEVGLSRLRAEEGGLDFHVTESNTSILQFACLFLDAADPRDEATLRYVASRTDFQRKRYNYIHRNRDRFYLFSDWHPILCAAVNKNASTLSWVAKWYSDMAIASSCPFATYSSSRSTRDADRLSEVIEFLYGYGYWCVADADAVSSIKRVMSLPGADVLVWRNSYHIMSTVIRLRLPDVMEYLVTLPFLDIGATSITMDWFPGASGYTSPLCDAVEQFADADPMDPEHAVITEGLKRIVRAIVRASVIRRDDGSGINDYVPKRRVYLIGLAVITGDAELVRILLSHPLCNPGRTSWAGSRDLRRDHGPMTAKDLAEGMGRRDIAEAVEQSMRAFSERTRSRCLEDNI